LTFDYATIEALTNYLAREVLALEQPEEPRPLASNGDEQLAREYAELEQLAPDDVKTLLDEELAAIDQLIGITSDD
jgi:hypothetical protein